MTLASELAHKLAPPVQPRRISVTLRARACPRPGVSADLAGADSRASPAMYDCRVPGERFHAAQTGQSDPRPCQARRTGVVLHLLRRHERLEESLLLSTRQHPVKAGQTAEHRAPPVGRPCQRTMQQCWALLHSFRVRPAGGLAGQRVPGLVAPRPSRWISFRKITPRQCKLWQNLQNSSSLLAQTSLTLAHSGHCLSLGLPTYIILPPGEHATNAYDGRRQIETLPLLTSVARCLSQHLIVKHFTFLTASGGVLCQITKNLYDSILFLGRSELDGCQSDLMLVMSRFALPALLPSISPELDLSDSQGALLTVGYAVSSSCPNLRCLQRTRHDCYSF